MIRYNKTYTSYHIQHRNVHAINMPKLRTSQKHVEYDFNTLYFTISKDQGVSQWTKNNNNVWDIQQYNTTTPMDLPICPTENKEMDKPPTKSLDNTNGIINNEKDKSFQTLLRQNINSI